jgi:hypothetical protein
MKTSRQFAPALFVLGAMIIFGIGFVSPVGKVMAEGVAEAVEAVTVQASANDGDRARICEEREVEADEGYGVSSKVIRLICH